MDRKTSLVPVAMLLAGVIVGIITAAVLGGSSQTPAAPAAETNRLRAAYERGMKDGRYAEINEINTKFMQKGLSGPLNADFNDAYGFVKEIKGNTALVEVDTAQFTVFDSGMAVKSIRVGPSTVVQKMVRQKAPATNGNGKAKASSGQGRSIPASAAPGGSGGELKSQPPLEPPNGAFAVVSSSFAELHVGDYVKVTAMGDLRLKDAGDAAAITVYDLHDMPSADPSDASTLPFSRAAGQPFVQSSPTEQAAPQRFEPGTPPTAPSDVPAAPSSGGVLTPPPTPRADKTSHSPNLQ